MATMPPLICRVVAGSVARVSGVEVSEECGEGGDAQGARGEREGLMAHPDDAVADAADRSGLLLLPPLPPLGRRRAPLPQLLPRPRGRVGGHLRLGGLLALPCTCCCLSGGVACVCPRLSAVLLWQRRPPPPSSPRIHAHAAGAAAARSALPLHISPAADGARLCCCSSGAATILSIARMGGGETRGKKRARDAEVRARQPRLCPVCCLEVQLGLGSCCGDRLARNTTGLSTNGGIVCPAKTSC